MHGLEVGHKVLPKVLERGVCPMTYLSNDGQGCLLHAGVGNGSEMLRHLVQFTLKVDDGPYSIWLPIAARLHWWQLRRRIKFEHFQVKVVDMGGAHSPVAHNSMRVSQSATIDDSNTPRCWLVEDVVGS